MENPSNSESTSSSHDENFFKASRGHRSSKELTCDVCGKSFRQTSHLKDHQRVHTGEKPFTCKECGICFNQKSHLVKHQRIHTGEKPFTCKECEKSFNQKSDLITHLRAHTGEKPFKCKECKKSFSVKSCLTRHEKIHTGEKPFSCNKCMKSFARKSHMTRHGRIHDNQEKSSFSETKICITVCSCSENSKVPVGEKSHISCECGETSSSLEGSSDCQEKSHVCVSYCMLCGGGLKETGYHNQVYQMASGELDDAVKNVNRLEDAGKELRERVSVENETDVDEIPFQSQVSKEFEYDDVKNVNLLGDTEKELHEGMYVKAGIDSDEIPSENKSVKSLNLS